MAGIIDQENIDERYGMTVDQWLSEKRVIQGVEQYGDYTDINGEECLFDADDLDNGLDGTGAPSEEPLRLFVETDVGVSGLRLPYVSTKGHMAFPYRHRVTRRSKLLCHKYRKHYFHTGGQVISDDPCRTFHVDWIQNSISIHKWRENNVNIFVQFYSNGHTENELLSFLKGCESMQPSDLVFLSILRDVIWTVA